MNLTWWKTCVVAGLLTCSLVGVANAQPGGGRGGPGGGFGGGGFGGGRGGSSLLSLADNEAVQKELEVGDDAKAAVKKVNESYREELTKAIEETTKSVNAKMTPQVKDALTADQYKRLQQIRVQAIRDAAFTDADVVKALGLKKEQQDKIADLGKEYGEKQRGLFGGGGGGGRPDFTEMRAKMEELNKEKDAKINEVLTKDQQDKFKALKGKEFDLASLQPRGFGGGGGPCGGGTGGRPGGAGGRPTGDGARPKTAPPVVD
jgi:Spy/CpxP family protein refolding chaperone